MIYKFRCERFELIGFVNNVAIETLMKIQFFYQIFACRMYVRLRFMVLNVTFNNISVMSWRSVLLVEETGVPG
jgi:hypothetical protein